MTFRITVKTVTQANKILTFTGVKSYYVDQGFIIFQDVLTGKEKRYDTRNVELEGE